MRWAEYEDGLEPRLRDLHERVHRGSYRAQASRRIYLRKPDGRQRPIGIAALEDKIAQQAVVTILNAIYEEDFRGFSYGFRPGRSPQGSPLVSGGIGCVERGDRTEGSELDRGCGHSGLLRQHESRMDDAFHPTPSRRQANSPPDPEMVESGSKRRRRVVGDDDRDTARGSRFTAADGLSHFSSPGTSAGY